MIIIIHHNDMNNQEYENKKRECWEDFKEKHFNGNAPWSPYSAFDFTFDRAYALGKQFGNPEQVDVEEAAEKHADELSVPSNIPGALVPLLHDIAKSSYLHGALDALGKQTETITQEDIEKLAKEFAERECEIGQVDRDALYKGYYHGMKDFLGKQEKDAEETVISGWVARASDGHLALFKRKPDREIYMRSNNGLWFGGSMTELDPTLFPDLTWDSGPIEVELIIKRKKK